MSKVQKSKLCGLPSNKALGALVFDKPHFLHSHEIETTEMIRRFGDEVMHISPSGRPGAKTADIRWRNELWEIKTIAGNSRSNIHHALQAAKTQSPNIIVCIPKTKRSNDVVLRDVTSYMSRSKSIKKVLVIIGQCYCEITRDLLQ